MPTGERNFWEGRENSRLLINKSAKNMGPEKKDYMEFLSQEANSTHRKFVTNTNNLNSFN